MADPKYSRTWTITLNHYQRDNLVTLLRVIGYPLPDMRDVVIPFSAANNGDWVGEIAMMLDCHDRDTPSANFTPESLRQDVAWQVRNYLDEEGLPNGKR